MKRVKLDNYDGSFMAVIFCVQVASSIKETLSPGHFLLRSYAI